MKHLPGWRGFLHDALRPAGWRMFLLLQVLALLYALIAWFELTAQGAQPQLLVPLLILRSLAALLVMAAALAADEAVRRGWPVWRAFLVAFASLGFGATLLEWCVGGVLGYRDSGPPGVIGYGVSVFLAVSGSWALVVLVFLDRQSAARKMAGVRAAEMQRLELEHRVTVSRLAAAGARLDPAAVFAQLAQIREFYAAALPGADQKLETLIHDLEESVRGAAGDSR